MTPGALEGVRILDLTAMTAGPVGTMMLGDLGADVIKVEDPKTGELSRNIGTVFAQGESSIFLSQNRNKRSVGLDLKSEDGRKAFLEIARHVDVVVENFRPGTVDRLGVGYDAVRAVNPDVIYASISAYGQSGPYAHLPANDPVIQAMSGLMHMTGEADGAPVRIGSPYPDFGAAALMAFSVSAALFSRERTGMGQYLDLSLLSGALFSTIPRDGETFMTGESPQRRGSAHPTFVPYRNFMAGDGVYFFLACFTQKFWLAMCNAIGRQDLITDPRFVNNTDRCENRDALDAELEATFATRDVDEWLAILGAGNVPAAKIQDLHSALTEDPQIAHNGTVVSVQHPTVGDVRMQAHPVNYHGTPATYRRPAPLLGEHTREVLEEFGVSLDMRERLVREKAEA